MIWNWQQSGWPAFTYDQKTLEPFEQAFLFGAGELVGAFRHVDPDDRDVLRIELIEEEAVKTSAIEGEVLDRASVQSSLRRQFGLEADRRWRRTGDRAGTYDFACEGPALHAAGAPNRLEIMLA
jgi:Fic family protein